MIRTILLLIATCMLALSAGDIDPSTAPGPNSGTSAVNTLGGAQQQRPISLIEQMFPFLMIGGLILFMWLMIFRPQRKEEKRKRDMLSATKRGDEVESIGGLRGEVDSVGEQTIDVKIGKNPSVVVTFSRVAVHRNLTQEAAQNPAAAKK